MWEITLLVWTTRNSRPFAKPDTLEPHRAGLCRALTDHKWTDCSTWIFTPKSPHTHCPALKPFASFKNTLPRISWYKFVISWMYICKKTNFFHEFYGGLAKLYVISWKQPFSFYATLIVYWIHIKIEYYNASDFSF